MSTSHQDLILTRSENHVTTLTMNMPKRLNGWTMEMLEALRAAMERAAADSETRVLILTGTDPYYCAGVNLGTVVKPQHPQALHEMIVRLNQRLFDLFLDFPKPILVAVNGPAIGASVTSATLCDAIIASENATFSTPFVALGVPPEGCSSVFFPRLLGEENARRMLGKEGWKPTGAEAQAIGLVDRVVPRESLMEEATKVAEAWVAEGRERTFRAGATRDELKAVNARESVKVADAFLGQPFLIGQFHFLRKKKKYLPAAMFLVLSLTRPAWSLLLKSS
ncbi:MAG: enoyl-CoA hydratase/isomerase family protein [Myxococcales bacterium]|nr:enoyl-CoA hydratase/isomerase family protein [Myxococcales bacterium]